MNNAQFTTSSAGRQLIESFEGLELTAYQDMVGVWTIGYGHTGMDVKPGLRISAAQAEALLAADLVKFEQGVARLVTLMLNQHQFDALVSFSYNLGLGSLKNSTLLKLLNSGDVAGAAEQFLRWDKAGGVRVAGLTRRRKAERELFLTLV